MAKLPEDFKTDLEKFLQAFIEFTTKHRKTFEMGEHDEEMKAENSVIFDKYEEILRTLFPDYDS